MTDTAQDSALFAAIMQASVDAIIVADERGVILRANPAAAEIFGYDHQALTGQSIDTLMPADIAHAHNEFIDRYMRTGERRILGTGRELQGKHKDGTIFPLHLSVGRAEVDGAPVFAAILHDLTERHATQTALARSQRLDAIGKLTRGIAHDFNNLLTVVIGNLELLEIRGATDSQLPLIHNALASAQLGAELTSRLMVFARRGNLKPERTDLRAQCEEAFEILKRTIGEHYEIETVFEDNLSPVMIDPVQFQSALINLALNARDAMLDGGRLHISIGDVTIDDTYIAQETDIAPGEYVRLTVTDSGEGMTQDAQRHAFEPFFTTKADTGGTGLGLSMVYGFVRQSGGHITLYSEVGQGTSFGLYFPKADDATAHIQVASKAVETVPQGNGQVVLVVEDNAKIRQLSIERVQALGYHTEEAASGDAAYALLKSGKKVDLVFSDLVMPGALNGYDLAERVLQEFPGTGVVLTSGYASDVVQIRSGGTPKHDILHKPFRQAELASRLQAVLGSADGGMSDI